MIRAAALGVLLLLPFVSPYRIFAQFQAPTDDELKMTDDPKAPGAAAVYLDLQEVTDDPLHYRLYSARIKVLKDKGKELATIELPYWHGDFKITDVKGRTIHSDGTVIPLVVKPEDLMVAKAGEEQLNKKVFTLPSVEVGSILEYSYELRYDDNHFSSPTWEIQRDYFIHKAHFAFTPFKAFQKGEQAGTSQFLVDSRGNSVNTLIWWKQLPAGADLKTDTSGRFKLDLVDVPATPKEEWMPPIESYLDSVRFYYMSAFSGGDFWVSEAKRWSKEVDHFAEPTKAIREAVAGIVAPTDSELDKAKKLYKAVQALDNTDFTRTKGKAELKQLGLRAAKRAEDTWAQKGGSSDDIALLYLAMVRAAGLTAYDMKVVDRARAVFTPAYMNFDQLDDDIVILSIGGKEILLDPGEKMCPFQTLSWRHSNAGGLRQSAEGRAAEITPMQPYTANKLTRVGEVQVDGHGATTATFRFMITGQEALLWRQASLENDDAEVKKQFDRWVQEMMPDGIEGHVDHFLGMDDPDVNLIAVVKASGTVGAATAKRLLLPGFFFESRGRMPFVDQEKRQEPVDMHYGEMTVDEITYHLPAGLKMEGAPQDAKIPWEGHAVAVFKTTQSGGGEVTVSRQFARAFTIAKPEEYQSLRDFYQKVATADQQQLVLTASSPAGGGH
jgi:hypothetical protein